MSEYQHILVDVDGPIARITLNRPERMNSMTNLMVRETTQALEVLKTNERVRVVVLTGAGKHFCPGADLQGVTTGSGSDAVLTVDDFRTPVLLREMPAVTIALVNGACAGAGFGWALACDLRVATRSAKFNSAFLDVGVAGDMSGPWTLPRLVGAAKARELYFIPDKFTADEAHRIGLVARVFDDETFAVEASAVVDRLANAADGLAVALHLLGVEAAEMLDAQDSVEPALAALAARRGSTADWDRLDALIEESEAVVDDPEPFNRLALAFHARIAEIAGNRVLRASVASLGLVQAAHFTDRGSPRSARAAVTGHRMVLRALREGDARAAEAAMDTHLAAVRAELQIG